MALYAPPMKGKKGVILSLFAWGQLAKTVVFDYNRAGNYVRDYIVPSQPRTPLQVAHRQIFADGMAAWGQLAKTVVFDYNRAGNYVRDYVVPSQPRTPLQVAHRQIFADGMAAWMLLGST